ncbi:Ig-specific serine endopeptidase MIP [Ureaplasma diversum]|uniref:Ig-specific serine endopeptidase MIP n=1 Tax=Ureaplasma diversum TaxID=42094 RepID=UPI000B1C834C|nr:DUF31 family protein [Ureaplasma diversum]
MKKSLFKKELAITLGLASVAIITPIIAIACNNETKGGDKQKDSPKVNEQPNTEATKTTKQKNETKLQSAVQPVFFKRDKDSHYVLSLNIPNVHGKFVLVKIQAENEDQAISSKRNMVVSNKVDIPFEGLKEKTKYKIVSIDAYDTNTSTQATSLPVPSEYTNKFFETKPIYATNFVNQEEFSAFENKTLQQKGHEAFQNLDKFNSEQWYEFENDFYLSILYNHYSVNGTRNFNPLQDYDNGLKVTDQQKQFFDNKAKELSQETYDKAALKGFTLPIYKENGNEVLGLSTKEGNPSLQHSSLASNVTRATGTPRILPGQKYKDIALQTISVNFFRPIQGQTRTVSGTMWILDYVPTTNGTYPTKWYFATNAHVAKELLTDLVGISFTFLKPEAKLQKTQKLIKLDEDYTILNIPTTNEQKFINTVYVATDFLNSKPSDFLTPAQADKYKDTDEFIDFAVFEVDFEEIMKIKESFIQQGGQTEDKKEKIESPAELAKKVTNEYATNKENHIKFLKTSYLQDFNKIDGPILDNTKWKDSLYTVGYPVAGAQEIDKTTERAGNALWTNSFYILLQDHQRNDQTYQNLGNLLSKHLGYRSFINKAGIIDGFIGIPKVDGLPLIYNNKHYWNMALEYSLFNFAAGGGSSGSSVRNQKNEIVGIVHLGNTNALVAVAAALRSEGYNYNGLYGKYNLPQYDLIFGGGKDQKSSYRQALVAKYGENFKTNIFKESVKSVPEDFKFKQS